QVGRQERGEQHIPTGPSHEEHRAGISVLGEGDQTGHRDERRGGHPVGGDGSAVGRGWDATACDIEASRVGHSAAVGDPDVETEGQDDEDQRPELSRAHEWCTSCSYSSTPYLRSRRSMYLT